MPVRAMSTDVLLEAGTRCDRASAVMMSRWSRRMRAVCQGVERHLQGVDAAIARERVLVEEEASP
jgi:hypothetical protein